jgi:hypothetical protein
MATPSSFLLRRYTRIVGTLAALTPPRGWLIVGSEMTMELMDATRKNYAMRMSYPSLIQLASHYPVTVVTVVTIPQI